MYKPTSGTPDNVTPAKSLVKPDIGTPFPIAKLPVTKCKSQFSGRADDVSTNNFVVVVKNKPDRFLGGCNRPECCCFRRYYYYFFRYYCYF